MRLLIAAALAVGLTTAAAAQTIAVGDGANDIPMLSTAGMGVYWLHVRLDTRPKYYQHTPYRDA